MQGRVRFVDARGFKEAALAGKCDGLGLQKAFACDEVKAADVERRVIDFVISTGEIDREGDVITPEGWELENFRKNPVVLFAHDHREPPIARALAIGAERGRLTARAEFMAPDLSPFSYMIFRMYAEGFMRATSVGFMPLEWSFAEEADRKLGIDFKRQELLEFSAVPVPANPEALVQARAKGIDTAPLRQWAERVLDGGAERDGVALTRKSLERLRRAADPRHVRQYYLPRHEQDELLRRNLAAQQGRTDDEVEARDPGGSGDGSRSLSSPAPLAGLGLRETGEGAAAGGPPPRLKITRDDGAERERACGESPAVETRSAEAAELLAGLEARIARVEATVRGLADRSRDDRAGETTGTHNERAQDAAGAHNMIEPAQDRAEVQNAVEPAQLEPATLAALVREIVSEKVRAITGRVD